ncbi:hypothetical protein Xkoz_03289 [Xenorhabdus kozodoii]|uniref:Uncharacterized protein n=1 Tax=Xenorhabdus kozodoii TaxID=351676 RepID=A0A2D0L2W2_9GAMM|nr:hypothetical protein Xkoz_03289 [Xenorhabdus kozodoii]
MRSGDFYAEVVLRERNSKKPGNNLMCCARKKQPIGVIKQTAKPRSCTVMVKLHPKIRLCQYDALLLK